MVLSDRIHTYGQHLLQRYGERVHKIARDQVFDLYATPAELVGLPKAWRGKPSRPVCPCRPP